MKLSELLYQEVPTTLEFDREITGLAIDSREVKPGYLFFAYQGEKNNGQSYIPDAIVNGATVILTEGQEFTITWNDSIPFVTIPRLKEKISELAAYFYQYPAKLLRIVGVTGTNGKTSCAHFIASSLNYLAIRCGVIGTLGNGLYGQLQEASLTTPDATVLHKTLAAFVKQDVSTVAMEVSSHSLEQGRTKGIHFEVGIFTNLTQDHLDYHGSMENYGKAKQKLFDQVRYAVVNVDDIWGKKLANILPKATLFTYSVEDKQAQVYATEVRLTLAGIDAKIISPWGAGQVTIPLIGKFNLSNVLAVFTTLCLLNIPFEIALMCLSQLRPIAGRMEMLGGNQQPLVIVDYSHTPDALEKALSALRYHCSGKLYCLFGCGGDRDRRKRPLMAKLAEQLADVVMLTHDNPRTENAMQIINDIQQGFLHPTKVKIQGDRAKAIATIISLAQTNDCVLIAGKGAEAYQQIGDQKIPFSDVQVAKACLSK